VIWNLVLKDRISPPSGYCLLREGRREILVRAGYEDLLRRQGLLDPAGLWARIPPLPKMIGRGEILLIKGQEEVAVRKYRHGGLLRRLSGDLFLFGKRPFREVEVAEKVKSAGIPTLEILAAILERGWGKWYRGYLITKYLPGAVDLISFLSKQPHGEERREVIKMAGELVRKMHQEGIYHADLHLKNFLVEEEGLKVYLIDFDKSKSSVQLSPSQRVKNLRRLDRSAEKLRGEGLPLTKEDKSIFCRAYLVGNKEIRPYIMAYLKRYRWYKLLYRWGWWIAKVLYPAKGPGENPSPEPPTDPQSPTRSGPPQG